MPSFGLRAIRDRVFSLTSTVRQASYSLVLPHDFGRSFRPKTAREKVVIRTEVEPFARAHQFAEEAAVHGLIPTRELGLEKSIRFGLATAAGTRKYVM